MTIYKHTRRGHAGRHHIDVMTGFDELNEVNKNIGTARWKIGRKLKAEYLNSEHSYQLKYGETKFGKPQTMKGWDALIKNRDYEDKFARAYDKDNTVRMWRLFLIKDAK